MSTENNILVAENEAEEAVVEFLEMRAAILGRLSPEALRCIPSLVKRYMDEGERKKTPR